MNGVSYLALGIGLLTETSFALGQVAGQMTVAQVTGSVPPSGVLITPPPAPSECRRLAFWRPLSATPPSPFR